MIIFYLSLENSMILLDYLQVSYLRIVFLRGKRKLIQNLISQIRKPYPRNSKLLACWDQLGGIRIETRNSFKSWLGGTWQFPSYSVVRTEVRYVYELVNAGYLNVQDFQPLKQLHLVGMRFLIFLLLSYTGFLTKRRY